MADKRGYNGYNSTYSAGGYGSARPSAGKMSKKELKKKEAKARRKEYNATLRARQNYAAENARYRAKIAAVGGIDNRYYTLPEDKKQRKEKDYFFVMRKFVCFLMMFLMLVSIAYFALNYVKIAAIPSKFTALFMETEAKKTETPGEGEDTGEETPPDPEASNADETGDKPDIGGETGDDTNTDDDTGTAGEEKTDTGIYYSALDPVFGFIKYVGNKFNMDIKIGESPLYDAMIAKVEVGMADTIAQYIILAFPVAMIVYIITALVMFIKCFIGMCGRRISKLLPLGSIVMLLCAAVTAFGGLAYLTDVAGKMNYGGIVTVLIGGVTGAGGFTGGYGLLILLGLPLIAFILSLFAKKKVPYSIFDTYGE